MAAAWFWLRADLRARRREIVGVAVLLGVTGGVVIAAAGGARRTSTALNRIVAAERSADVSVNPNDSPDPARWAAIDHLPNVVSSETLRGLYAAPVDAHGLVTSFDSGAITAADVEGRLFRRVERYRITKGHLYDSRRDDEVMINDEAARLLHLHVGSIISMGVLTQRQVDEATHAKSPQPVLPQFVLRARVTGVAVSLDDVSRASDDPNRAPFLSFTPALARRTEGFGSPYAVKLIRLRHGAKDLPAFEQAVRQTAGVDVLFQERRLTEARVRRAERPYVVALLVFTVLGALALIAVAGQLIARTRRGLRDERDTLVALGFTTRDVQRLSVMRAAIIGCAGAAIACVAAIALSPWFPLGPVRRLEPAGGFAVDVPVIGAGLLLIVAVAVVAGSLRFRGLGRARRPAAPIASTGSPVELATGVRFAFDRGRDGSVPLVSTLLGVTVALAAVCATVTYAGALTRFTGEPKRYGWPWGAEVLVNDGNPATVNAAIVRQPGIATTSPGVLSQIAIGNLNVAAVGLDPTDGVPGIPLLKGRAPKDDDEIVLGATTLRSLHAHIGGTVDAHVQQRTTRFHVVGVGVFPRFAPYPTSEPTGLGVGAATTAHAIADAALGAPFVLVAARPGTDLSRRSLQHSLDSQGFATTVLGPQRPNDVQSYDQVTRTPLFLVTLLILLAVGSAVHLLVTGVRARRRDLAVLKTIGFTRGQARRTVFVQATTLTLLALAVAVPVGIVAGRLFWLLTAHALGIADDTAVPLLGGFAVVGAAILVANLIALGPARTAARIRPAVALRAE